jgi:hypothetical protein
MIDDLTEDQAEKLAIQLTKEKNLFDIFWLSSKITTGKLHRFIVCLSFILLAHYSFFLATSADLSLQIREWGSFGIEFSITTLGFLIAGFTIFATLSKPHIMLTMMTVNNKDVNLPYLKYFFFTFMKVFITYISFSVIYLSIIIFGSKGGYFSKLILLLFTTDAAEVKWWFLKSIYPFLGASFFHLILLLKSFVFNTYISVMTFLRFELKEIIENKKDKDKPNSPS